MSNRNIAKSAARSVVAWHERVALPTVASPAVLSQTVVSSVAALFGAALLAFALLAAPLMMMFFPAAAYADYSNSSVKTTAQMRTNGALHVAEQRIFDFREEYSILRWAFTGLSEEQEVTIESVRITQMDSEGNVIRDSAPLEAVPFQSSWRDFVRDTEGVTTNVDKALEASARTDDDASDDIVLPTGNAYAFDARRDMLYVFMEPTSQLTVVECDYLIDNAASVYDDVAELYWDYVSANDDVDIGGVSVQIQLPVPEGVAVLPGENVMAWGHGPEGTIDVKSDGTIDYHVAEAGEGRYAQAHLLFPSGWLSNLSVQQKIDKSGLRSADAIAEEAAWTDSYTASCVNDFILTIVMLAVCVLALAGSIVAYMLLGRERCPRTGTDCGADPSGLDAAVRGRLMRWNLRSSRDFAATLRQLADKGVITVTCGTPRDASEVRFRITPSAKLPHQSPLERDAMRIVFDMVGDGYQSVSMDDIRSYCRRNASEVEAALRGWQDMLTRDVTRAGLFDARSVRVAKVMAVVAATFIIVGIVELVGGAWLQGFALVVTGVMVVGIAYHMPRRTQLGSNLAWHIRQLDSGTDGRSSSNAVERSDSQAIEQDFNAADECNGRDDWQDTLAEILDSVCMTDKRAGKVAGRDDERKEQPWARLRRRKKTT